MPPRHDDEVAALARVATAADLPHALEVWRAANIARGRPPAPPRIARVAQKLAAPDATVLVAAAADELIGMLHAEPARADNGRGAVVSGLCHISMVFVDPRHWGRRIGQLLLDELTTVGVAHGYADYELWTGTGNEQAQRLYRRAGFVASDQWVTLATGEVAVRFLRTTSPKTMPSS